MNLQYVPARLLQYTTGLNWTTATIKAMLVMTSSTAGDDIRAQKLTGGTGFALMDEFDGVGYSRQTLASVTATDDLPTGDIIVTCALLSFGATISNGSRQAKGIVIFLDAANDGLRQPLLWLDSVANGPTFPYSPNGGPIRMTPGTRGLFRARSVTALP